jgi:hypothetical protein
MIIFLVLGIESSDYLQIRSGRLSSLLVFPVMSATAFANIPDKRRKAYRVGFCFSSMVNTGILVFILSVRAIFAEDESKKIRTFWYLFERN